MKAAAFTAALMCLVAASKGAAASRKGCHEVSDVVGYERCTRYGAGWSVEKAPPLALELVVEVSRLDPRGHTMSGNFGKGQSGMFTYPGDAVGHALEMVGLGPRIDV